MLKDLVIENLFSYEKEKISFAHENEKNNSISCIFGNNGSGKSGLLNSVKYLAELMVNETFKKLNILPDKRNFIFSDKNFHSLKATFSFNNFEYDFFFKISNRKIVDQKLKVKKNRSDKWVNVFDNENFNTYFFDSKTIERIETYKISERSIFNILINDINLEKNKKLEFLLEISNFIKGAFYSYSYDYIKSDEVIKNLNNPNFKKWLINKLGEIEININDYEIEDKTDSVKNLIKKIEANNDFSDVLKRGIINDLLKTTYDIKLKYAHDNKKALSLDYESSGTIKFINLLVFFRMLEIKNKKTLIIFDEIEQSLHPFLIKKLIQFIKEMQNIQLIFTTHEIDLLDNKLFFKNNIFFIQKQNGRSNWIPLKSVRNLRNDERNNWKKMYVNDKLKPISFSGNNNG